MTDFPEDTRADGSERTADAEQAASEATPPGALGELLRLARNEAPARPLEARVLQSVASRNGLLESERRPSSLVLGGILAGAGAMALAASIVLWLSRSPEEPAQPTEHANIELGREPIEAPSSLPGAITSTVAPSQLPVPEDPCRQPVVASGSEPLIDDFEDGDDAILSYEQRAGLWRWVRDTDAPGTAPALLPVPRSGKTPKNQLALRVKGDRLREWGATIEFVFESRCYDASAYAGIAFDARGSTRVYLAPREVSVMPVSAGGTCVEDCHNNHVKQIRLEPDWQTFEVRFDEVEQRGYDRPRLDPKRLHSIAFLVRPEDTPYDVWIDDVRFIER